MYELHKGNIFLSNRSQIFTDANGKKERINPSVQILPVPHFEAPK